MFGHNSDSKLESDGRASWGGSSEERPTASKEFTRPTVLPTFSSTPSRKPLALGGRVTAAVVAAAALASIYTICCLPAGPTSRPSTVLGDSPFAYLVLDRPPLPQITRLIINMVSAKWGLLWAARATAFVVSSPLHKTADAVYARNSLDAAKALQAWYDTSTGLWLSAGWWNSANCLTVLGDWALLDKANAVALGVASVMANTYNNAQKTSVTTQKRLAANGLVMTKYEFHRRAQGPGELNTRGFSGFINDFYDDEGWWALALIRSWDVTGQQGYLDMAEHIFEDMKNGTDQKCGGGIWWSKERAYKNAIANELYLSVAASLANRVPGNKDYYLGVAKAEWAWFKGSGMINANSLINDGLRINDDGSCVNNGQQTWSYNQGVVLGGLVELARATGDGSYLSEATAIAAAALSALSDPTTGIIHETDRCEPNCGADGSQFKGIFVRNLHYLQAAAPQNVFRSAINKNADSIWANNRNELNQLGIDWAGPASAGGGPNATTHSSAMDVIVAALAAAE
ncbi:glycosyl hydrolase family 76-domain-containing protein [Lasiosphaeria ovina]|uniref:Glycosyl hydrolase family 76-domain-containing protein n=1 Tax=Lasiosphaeria ovina TaxID=92902 RepID=A0AAE0KD31_9PEZI|nr:glycosyl hydrolase family 76-domain-containing protein [Lasiosphaeria ovina]